MFSEAGNPSDAPERKDGAPEGFPEVFTQVGFKSPQTPSGPLDFVEELPNFISFNANVVVPIKFPVQPDSQISDCLGLILNWFARHSQLWRMIYDAAILILPSEDHCL